MPAYQRSSPNNELNICRPVISTATILKWQTGLAGHVCESAAEGPPRSVIITLLSCVMIAKITFIHAYTHALQAIFPDVDAHTPYRSHIGGPKSQRHQTVFAPTPRSSFSAATTAAAAAADSSSSGKQDSYVVEEPSRSFCCCTRASTTGRPLSMKVIIPYYHHHHEPQHGRRHSAGGRGRRRRRRGEDGLSPARTPLRLGRRPRAGPLPAGRRRAVRGPPRQRAAKPAARRAAAAADNGGGGRRPGRRRLAPGGGPGAEDARGYRGCPVGPARGGQEECPET